MKLKGIAKKLFVAAQLIIIFFVMLFVLGIILKAIEPQLIAGAREMPCLCLSSVLLGAVVALAVLMRLLQYVTKRKEETEVKRAKRRAKITKRSKS